MPKKKKILPTKMAEKRNSSTRLLLRRRRRSLLRRKSLLRRSLILVYYFFVLLLCCMLFSFLVTEAVEVSRLEKAELRADDVDASSPDVRNHHRGKSFSKNNHDDVSSFDHNYEKSKIGEKIFFVRNIFRKTLVSVFLQIFWIIFFRKRVRNICIKTETSVFLKILRTFTIPRKKKAITEEYFVENKSGIIFLKFQNFFLIFHFFFSKSSVYS